MSPTWSNSIPSLTNWFNAGVCTSWYLEVTKEDHVYDFIIFIRSSTLHILTTAFFDNYPHKANHSFTKPNGRCRRQRRSQKWQQETVLTLPVDAILHLPIRNHPPNAWLYAVAFSGAWLALRLFHITWSQRRWTTTSFFKKNHPGYIF